MIIDLPNLYKLIIGHEALPNIEDVLLNGLLSLKEVWIDERGEITSFSPITEFFVRGDHSVYIHNAVTRINLPAGSYNDYTNLRLHGFPRLRDVRFGANSFGGVHSFIMDNIPLLKSLTIGSYSFFNASMVSLSSIIK